MKTHFALIVLLAALRLVADSVITACDQLVADDLLAAGIEQGHNAESGDFTVIAHAFVTCERDKVASFSASVVDAACTKAKLEILKGMCSEIRAANAVWKTRMNGLCARGARATCEAVFTEVPIGFEVVSLRRMHREGFLVASVGMRWSERREVRARESLAGMIAPAPEWPREFKESPKARDPASLPSVDVFVDSNGHAHFYSMASGEVCDKFAAAQLMRLEMRVRRGLQLALEGQGTGADAIRVEMESQSEEGRCLSKRQDANLEVRARGVLPPLRGIFEGPVRDAVSGRSVYVMVYAISD